MHLLEV